MSLSRRAFVRTLGGASTLSGVGLAARGREALVAERWPRAVDAVPPPEAGEIRISSNENPLGPGPAAVEAILKMLPSSGRYPMNTRPRFRDVTELIAKMYDAEPQNVVLGAGSGEILDNAVAAFTSPTRALVTADPSFESPRRTAEALGHPVRAIPVDAAGKLDVSRMAAAAKGAGLVFFCNPNNPTATVHDKQVVTDFITEVTKSSPGTVILLDEAYHDYVTDPAYASGASLALANANVLVSRTFSKAYGMAGLRLGYGVGSGQTIEAMQSRALTFNANVGVVAGAHATLQDPQFIPRERERNTKVRQFTLDFFKNAGYEATDSQTNFIFVNIRRPARVFREACAKENVFVGRDFPPFEETHARISIGTMEEMQRAVGVFRQVLASTTSTASGGSR